MIKDEESREEKLKSLREKLDKLIYSKRASRIRNRRSSYDINEVKKSLRKKRGIKEEPSRMEEIVYRRDLPRSDSSPTGDYIPPGEKISLEEAIQGETVHHPEAGTSILIVTPVDDPSDESSVSSRLIRKFDPSELIFMDIETTGLGNSPLFLIGTLIWDKSRLTAYQYFARNYAEEPSVIALFLDACRTKKLLITFNGKSFDIPYIRTRAAANTIPFQMDADHFDLLHECRKLWRGTLPNCRLQTIERFICGRSRSGDIPGEQIPEAYHAYVRTDNARQIVEILKHNMLDLITMADLLTRLPDRQS